MIRFANGDMLQADVEALVNTVNCVGVMGRGVALQFKSAFPANFADYADACRADAVQPGRMFVHATGALTNPRWIINFPTKRHWRGRSRIEDIDAGLVDLVRVIGELGIRSIALPPLGSGLGGLDWREVRRRIVAALEPLTGVEVAVFEPRAADAPVIAPKRSAIPTLTPGRAALVGLLDRYVRGLMEPYATLLEVHKLSYFLQLAGQPLKLRFVKAHYGPYAENLRYVMHEMEGYYTAGYADGGDQPFKRIELVPGALGMANDMIAADADLSVRFDRVVDLVEGFETPLGMELLATALWVVREEGARSVGEACARFGDWNARKSSFTERQVGLAMSTLSARGWFPGITLQ